MQPPAWNMYEGSKSFCQTPPARLSVVAFRGDVGFATAHYSRTWEGNPAYQNQIRVIGPPSRWCPQEEAGILTRSAYRRRHPIYSYLVVSKRQKMFIDMGLAVRPRACGGIRGSGPGFRRIDEHGAATNPRVGRWRWSGLAGLKRTMWTRSALHGCISGMTPCSIPLSKSTQIRRVRSKH